MCYIPKCTEDVKAIKRIACIIDVYIILEIVGTLKIGITGDFKKEEPFSKVGAVKWYR